MKLDNLLNTVDQSQADLPVFRVALDMLRDNPYQPRARYKLAEIDELAQSIYGLRRQLPATLGMQQLPAGRLVDGEGEPIDKMGLDAGEISDLLRSKGVYVELAYGHKRSRAWRMIHEGTAAGIAAQADYAEIPIYVVPADDSTMIIQAIAENHQRSDISAVEQARAMQAYVDAGHSITAAGKLFGMERSVASNRLRLLQLPADVQESIIDGDLSFGQARALLPLADYPDSLQELASNLNGDSVANIDIKVKDRIGEIESAATRERQLQIAAEASAAAGIAAAVLPGQRRLHMYHDGGAVIGEHGADAALIESGVLLDENLAMQYVDGSAYYKEKGWKPAPDAAPDVVYVYTDTDRIAELRGQVREALEEDATAEHEAALTKRRAMIADGEATASAMVADAVAQLGGAAALWSNVRFLQRLALHLASWENRGRVEALDDVEALQMAIAEGLLIELDWESHGHWNNPAGESTAASLDDLIRGGR